MTGDLEARRRGVYEIGDDELARLLRLPAGQRVLSVSSDWSRSALLIMVEGDGLPEVYPGGAVPFLNKWGRFRTLGDDFRLDVAKLSPAAAHAAVLAELGAVRFEDPDALGGRRRILERHAPREAWTAWDGCSSCVGEIGGDPENWPCIDYLDAVAGLVTGLPGQAEYANAIDVGAGCTMLEDPGPPTPADLALLADPAAGAALDALVLGATGAALDAATTGDDPPPLRERLLGRPEETEPTEKEG